MHYQLDELARMSHELGLESRRVDTDRLDVILSEGCILTFCNLPQEDTLVGFDGTPWHAHGIVSFCRRDGFVECYDELDLLLGLGLGELVVISQFLDGKIAARRLAHKDEPLDLRDIRPSEELRVFCLPDRHRAAER